MPSREAYMVRGEATTRRLREALDEMGVQPGASFVVAPQDRYDQLVKEARRARVLADGIHPDTLESVDEYMERVGRGEVQWGT